VDEDETHVSDWHEDAEDEADESDDEQDDKADDEEFAELDEEPAAPVNAPRPRAGKIEARKPGRGKGRQSRSA